MGGPGGPWAPLIISGGGPGPPNKITYTRKCYSTETLCNCILVNHTNNNCVYTECSSCQLSFIETKEGRNSLDNDCHNL